MRELRKVTIIGKVSTYEVRGFSQLRKGDRFRLDDDPRVWKANTEPYHDKTAGQLAVQAEEVKQ